MQLYSITVRTKDDDAGSDREEGLKSPYGRRGAICSHFGWTWDYLHNGIAWETVQKMLMDAPSYKSSKDKEKDEIQLSEENAQATANYINGLTG